MENGNILDFRIAVWGRDPVTRELLEGISTLTDDEKLLLLDRVAYLRSMRKTNPSFIAAVAAELRERRIQS